VYLIDEILSRTLKMHHEHVYCTRFMVPHIHFERINVTLDICTENYSQVIDTIQYVMVEQGYPKSPCHLKDICPELAGLNGETLKTKVLAQQHGPGAPTQAPRLGASSQGAQVDGGTPASTNVFSSLLQRVRRFLG